MHYKNLVCSLVCLCFAVVIGTSIVENWAAVPKPNVKVLRSISQKPAARDIHPVMLLVLVSMIVVSWKSQGDEKAQPNHFKCN